MFQRVEPDINVKRECEEKAVHVDINIPEILKKKLEDDCFYINKRKKVGGAGREARTRSTAKNSTQLVESQFPTEVANLIYFPPKKSVK